MHDRNAAISFACTKETALYFDYIIPVFAAAEMLGKAGQLAPWPRAFGNDLLPDDLRGDKRFTEQLVAVNEHTMQVMFKFWINQFGLPQRIGGKRVSDEDFAAIEEVAAQAYFGFLRDFGLTHVPVIAGDASVSETKESDANIAITLSTLRLIDVSRTSWEQIAEFRRDADARAKLRRLRLFAKENYAGKSRAYVEDDLLTKIDDYQEQVRRWGFETKHCVLSMLLTSKSLAGALSGSLISTLFGAPAAAVASAVAGTVIEFGRVCLEVSRRKFVLRNALRDNPISYLAEVKTKLSGNA